MDGARPGEQWSSWDGLPEGHGGRVVSSSLRAVGQAVENPLLPKTRSWFALGAPLELLSPLSCWRILFVATALWCGVVAVIGGGPGPRLGVVITAAALAIVWIGLLRVRRVDALASELLGDALVTGGAVVVWSAGASPAAAGVGPCLIVGAAVAGIFLPPRAIARLQVLTAMAFAAALTPIAGLARGLALAGAAGLTSAAVAAVAAYLAASARRHGVVDPDTGLPNGFGLARRLAGRSPGSPLLVAVVALGGLAEVREALGYQVGTELLRRTVEDIGQVLPPDALIGRVAGDELVVVLAITTESAGESGAGGDAGLVPLGASQAGVDIANTLGRAVRAGRYVVEGIELAVRPHVGVALAPWHGREVAELVRRASLSAGRAEGEGLDLRLWDGRQGAMTREDLALLADLRLAAGRGELRLVYQPQIDAHSGATVSVEALLRWDSPVHGAVPPARLIPLAERTGLVGRLTDWVLATALDAQARWRAAGLDLPVSVNLSAVSLTWSDLARWVLGEMAARALPHACLLLELTETAPTSDLLEAIEALRPLHETGIRLSIDDFGTGYTSLSALPHLPLDELKIDQSFVRRVITSSADEAIVRSVTELAHRLGLTVVAEGVEDGAIASRIAALGIDVLQGYHFARPMPEDELLRFVSSHPVARRGGDVAPRQRV